MKRSDRARRNRYRGLRGLVRHVLWRKGRRTPKPPPEGPVVRDPAARIAYGGKWGTCTWCGLPAFAERTGRKIYAVAFLEANLWWLCHVAKTNFDRAWMRQLDNPAEDEPVPDHMQMRFVLE